MPFAPTAQTSLAPLPQTRWSQFIVPLNGFVTLDQAPPFQCKMVPESPTAQTSLAPLPHVQWRSVVVPLSTLDQTALSVKLCPVTSLPSTDTVMLSVTLDDAGVPDQVVDFVMYHELLHRVLGAPVVDGRVRAHTPEFRRRERAFPDYDRARSWLDRQR